MLAGGTQANAGVGLVDDFNDGSTDGWTVQNGSIFEMGGLMSGDNSSLALMDGMSGTQIGVDAVMGNNVNYVALVLNYTSLSDNLFIKIQDNNGNGLFDRIFFYHGNNGSDGLIGADFFDFSFEVSSSYFEVTLNGDGTVIAYVEATGDFFGGTLTNAYGGTGIGLGFFGSGANGGADNFYIVPGPGALALLALGAVGIRRKRKRAA